MTSRKRPIHRGELQRKVLVNQKKESFNHDYVNCNHFSFKMLGSYYRSGNKFVHSPVTNILLVGVNLVSLSFIKKQRDILIVLIMIEY